MPHLILVKHSLPEIVPMLPANQWRLLEAGRARCVLLADQLAHYAPAVLVSSPEPKAIETAQLLAQRLHTSVRVMDGLHEHDRSNSAWLGPQQFAGAVEALFHHPSALVMGRETANQASERFARTVTEVTSGSMEQNVVVVTHGTVLALFVARATGLELAPEGYHEARVLEKVQHITHTVRTLLDTAAHARISTYRAAIRLAEHKLGMACQTTVGSTSGSDVPAEASVGGDPERHPRHSRQASGWGQAPYSREALHADRRPTAHA